MTIAWRLRVPAWLMIVVSAGFIGGCGLGTSLGGAHPWSRSSTAFDSDFRATDADTASPLRSYFNDTYAETIEKNEPKARMNPKNTDKSLFGVIREARQTLDVSFYDIGSVEVANALVVANKRGVKIRVITDTDNLSDDETAKPRESLNRLRLERIPIRDDKRSAIMHDKYVIADRGVVWTGSTNATDRSLYQHNNNAVVLRSETLAGIYSRRFERQFVDGQFGPTETLDAFDVAAPISIGDARVTPYFSPRGGCKAAVVTELQKARKRIRFMTFSLTDSEVGNILVAKKHAGLQVEGVMDRWLAAGQYSLFDSLKRRGLPVVKDGNQALMHHKVFVIDDETVITGSFNYSQNAEAANNENFLVISSKRVGQAYSGEFRRVAHAARTNHPPPFKPKDPESGNGG